MGKPKNKTTPTKVAREVQALKLSNPANQLGRITRSRNQPRASAAQKKKIPKTEREFHAFVHRASLCPIASQYSKLVDDPWNAKWEYQGQTIFAPITNGEVPCSSVGIRRYGSVVITTTAPNVHFRFHPEGRWVTDKYVLAPQTYNVTTYVNGPQMSIAANPCVGFYTEDANTPESQNMWTAGGATNTAAYTGLPYDIVGEPMQFSVSAGNEEAFRMTAFAVKITDVSDVANVGGTCQFFQSYEIPNAGVAASAFRQNAQYINHSFGDHRSVSATYYPNCDSVSYHPNQLYDLVSTTQPPCRFAAGVSVDVGSKIKVEWIWFGELVGERLQSIAIPRVISADQAHLKSAIPTAFASGGGGLSSELVKKKTDSSSLLKKLSTAVQAGFHAFGGWDAVAPLLELL